MPDQARLDIEKCARCGMDHEALVFEALEHPMHYGDRTWTHWAACPETGEPVMACFEEAAVDRCGLGACAYPAYRVINDEHYFCRTHYEDLFVGRAEGSGDVVWTCREV